MKKKICFFGAASNYIDNKYKEEIRRLGEKLGSNYDLVFGGGDTGLMGEIARGFKEKNAHILGVVPKFIIEFEDVYNKCNELLFVDSMHERKKIMEDKADLFIIGPGGLGTMDEFFEVLTDKNLDRYDTPVFLFNIDGFYDDIVKFININLSKNIINRDRFNNFYVCNSIKELIDLLLLLGI